MSSSVQLGAFTPRQTLSSQSLQEQTTDHLSATNDRLPAPELTRKVAEGSRAPSIASFEYKKQFILTRLNDQLQKIQNIDTATIPGTNTPLFSENEKQILKSETKLFTESCKTLLLNVKDAQTETALFDALNNAMLIISRRRDAASPSLNHTYFAPDFFIKKNPGILQLPFPLYQQVIRLGQEIFNAAYEAQIKPSDYVIQDAKSRFLTRFESAKQTETNSDIITAYHQCINVTSELNSNSLPSYKSRLHKVYTELLTKIQQDQPYEKNPYKESFLKDIFRLPDAKYLLTSN